MSAKNLRKNNDQHQDQGVQGEQRVREPLDMEPPPFIPIPVREEDVDAEPAKQQRRHDDHDERLPDTPWRREQPRQTIDHSRVRYGPSESDQTHQPESPNAHDMPAPETQMHATPRDDEPGMDVDWVDTHMTTKEDIDFLHLFDLADRNEMRRTHEEIMATIDMLGGSVKSYRRERRARARAIVSEI